MATKNICPRAHGEGSLGKDGRSWGDARLLALNGQALSTDGKADINIYGLIRTASAAMVEAGTAEDAAVTPAALLGQAQPLNLATTHKLLGKHYVDFMIRIKNDAGTLKHCILNPDNSPWAVGFSVPVVGASSTYNAIPTVDGSTGFVAGCGIQSSDTNCILFDTVHAVYGFPFLHATVAWYDGGASAPRSYAEIVSYDVNGTTIQRPRVELWGASGAAWAVNTSNIPNGKFLYIRITGYMPV